MNLLEGREIGERAREPAYSISTLGSRPELRLTEYSRIFRVPDYSACGVAITSGASFMRLNWDGEAWLLGSQDAAVHLILEVSNLSTPIPSAA